MDCGALSMARIAETMTALLISVNRTYKVRGAGFRIVGRDVWGDPRAMSADGELVRIDDTSLFVVERGSGYPVIVLHGGPGLDHHEFADYLDPLTDEFRLLLVDQRANGRSERPPESTWTLERMAQDVIMLARAMHSGPLRGARALLRRVRRAAERGRLPGHGGADDRERRHPVHEVPGGGRGQPQRVRAGRRCASR